MVPLGPRALLQLLTRCLEKLRFVLCRVERALRVVERAASHAAKLGERDHELLNPSRVEFVALYHPERAALRGQERFELDVLDALDQLTRAASESVLALNGRQQHLTAHADECRVRERLLIEHQSYVRLRLSDRNRTTADSNLAYVAIHHDASEASDFVDTCRVACREALDAVHTHTTRCASTSMRVASMTAEISHLPHRLSLDSRLRLWRVGLDELIASLGRGHRRGATSLDEETPTGLLKGRYHFDSPYNLESMALGANEEAAFDEPDERVAMRGEERAAVVLQAAVRGRRARKEYRALCS